MINGPTKQLARELGLIRQIKLSGLLKSKRTIWPLSTSLVLRWSFPGATHSSHTPHLDLGKTSVTIKAGRGVSKYVPQTKVFIPFRGTNLREYSGLFWWRDHYPTITFSLSPLDRPHEVSFSSPSMFIFYAFHAVIILCFSVLFHFAFISSPYVLAWLPFSRTHCSAWLPVSTLLFLVFFLLFLYFRRELKYILHVRWNINFVVVYFLFTVKLLTSCKEIYDVEK